jgi:hypothetical protein
MTTLIVEVSLLTATLLLRDTTIGEVTDLENTNATVSPNLAI